MNYPKYLYNDEILETCEINDLVKLLNSNILNMCEKSGNTTSYNDSELFNYVNNIIIKRLNDESDKLKFVLTENAIKVTKYHVGDFLKKSKCLSLLNITEFSRYKFMIILKPCIKGGITQLYIDDEIITTEKILEKAGSILLYRNDICIEESKIEDGEKYIMTGDIICYQQTNDELICIKPKNSDNNYLARISDISNTVYGAYISFLKSEQTSKSIYYYDCELTEDEFLMYYNQIYRNLDINELKTLDRVMKYIGESKYCSILKAFNEFLEDECEPYLMCSVEDYYLLLQLKNQDVIPYQQITLEHTRDFLYDEEVNVMRQIIWFGTDNDKFLTADFLFRCITYPDCYYLARKTCTNKNTKNSSEDGYTHAFRVKDAELHDINFLEDEQKSFELINDYFLETGNKITIDMLHHKSEWLCYCENDYDEYYSEKQREKIRKYIFDKFKMVDVKNITKHNNVFEYANFVADYISTIDNTQRKDEDSIVDFDRSSVEIPNKIAKEVCSRKMAINKKGCDNIETKQMEYKIYSCILKKIKETNNASFTRFVSMVDNVANINYYITYNLVFKFGFYKTKFTQKT